MGSKDIALEKLLPTLEAVPKLRSLSLAGFEIRGSGGRLRDALPLLSELRLRHCQICLHNNIIAPLGEVVEKLEVPLHNSIAQAPRD